LWTNVKSRKDNSRLERDTSPGLALDAALVASTTDAEETVLSPVGVPGVGASPELLTVLLTVADKLDSVTALIATSGVVVDTASIGHEISVDSESNLEGTVGGELSLHVLLTDDDVALGTLALVSVPVKRRIASAVLLAVRGDHAAVVASSVRIAVVRDNTLVAPVGPGAARLTTVARTAAREGRVRAAVDILSRETDDLLLVDAHTIAHGLSSTEGPARAALTLITDILHGGAVRPLGASIESLGSSSDLSSRELLNPPAVGVEVLHVNTEKSTSLALGHAGDMIVGSLPGGLLLVDLTDHGADSDLLSEGCSGKHSNNKGNLVHV